MYSPPVGGAARRPIATIDKQQTSNRRLIIFGEEDYLCGERNSQVLGRDRRACSSRRKASKRTRGGPSPSRFLSTWIHFFAYDVLPGLPLSNQRELIAANERFCRQGTRIIVRRHYKSIRARAHDCEQIAFPQFGHFPVKRKKISRLTHRSNDVDFSSLAVAPAHKFTLTWRFASASLFDGDGARLIDRHDFVIALVQRRPDEIVHAGIHNGEFL